MSTIHSVPWSIVRNTLTRPKSGPLKEIKRDNKTRKTLTHKWNWQWPRICSCKNMHKHTEPNTESHCPIRDRRFPLLLFTLGIVCISIVLPFSFDSFISHVNSLSSSFHSRCDLCMFICRTSPTRSKFVYSRTKFLGNHQLQTKNVEISIILWPSFELQALNFVQFCWFVWKFDVVVISYGIVIFDSRIRQWSLAKSYHIPTTIPSPSRGFDSDRELHRIKPQSSNDRLNHYKTGGLNRQFVRVFVSEIFNGSKKPFPLLSKPMLDIVQCLNSSLEFNCIHFRTKFGCSNIFLDSRNLFHHRIKCKFNVWTASFNVVKIIYDNANEMCQFSRVKAIYGHYGYNVPKNSNIGPMYSRECTEHYFFDTYL